MNELSHTLFEFKSASLASDGWNREISGAEIDTVSDFLELFLQRNTFLRL